MAIPPGILYLARTFIYAVPPVGVTYLFFSYVLDHAFPGLSFTTPLRAALAFTSVLLYPWIMFGWRNYVDWTEARRRGAVLVPKIYDRLPGGLGITKALVGNFKAGYVGDIFERWREELGNTYGLNLLSERRVITFEPDHIKAILATQFDTFDKGPALFDQFRNLLGTGVFNSDGDMWKFHRHMTRPFFSRDRITDFDPIFDTHALSALSLARTRLSQGYPIDFQDLVSRFTLDSATAFLCGQSVDSLSAGLPFPEHGNSVPPMEISVKQRQEHERHASTKFVEAFLDGQHLTALRTRYGPMWPIASGEFWEDKVDIRRKTVDAFVEPIVKRALENVKDGKSSGKVEENVTLLDHLVSETQDMQILKDEVVNLLVAARDTTASTLTFSLYMLSEHPDVAAKLREEIVSVMGPGNARPTNEQIKEMKYMRAFLNEVLRLYPPVPFDSRASNKGTLWPMPANGPTGGRPYYIPPNTKCAYGVFLMHRREDLWGPDAAIFDPERFLDARLGKYLTPNPFIFLPFNAGPRICLGQQFAYYESSFFLIRLLQQFSSFELAQDAQPPETVPPKGWRGNFKGSKGTDKVWPGTHLTMYVRGGLWAKMTEGDLPILDA